jgi:endonuclease G
VTSRQVESILADAVLTEEMTRRMPALRRDMLPRAIIIPPGQTTPESAEPALALPAVFPLREGVAQPEDALFAAADYAGIEAIVRRFGRPSLLVRNNTFDVPAADTWKARLYPTKARLDRAIRSVGRIEIPALSVPHVGTAWMISNDVAVTNRHVALTFAERSGRRFAFRTTPIGERYTGSVDFREEAIQTTPFEVEIHEVLFIADAAATEPDIAFIRLRSRDGRPLPPPLALFDGAPKVGQWVVTIGYPAQDPRNPYTDQARIFEGVFNVKRLAPGEVMQLHDADVFSHDCTTLGGSSGSVVVDVETGRVLGLHFGGAYLSANYALSGRGIAAALARSRRRVRVPPPASEPDSPPDEEVTVRAVAGRRGFSPSFLGKDERSVPLPRLSPTLAARALAVTGGTGNPARFLLKYEHFSIAMHRQRRMAIYTAVNIDGDDLHRFKRGRDVWAKDPRIPPEAQIGNELYSHNDLDRGHLVRRLDPVWGASAKEAERDTFFYTNSTPQHATFNQTLWSELEDYLLDHADTDGFQASVFTGPIFNDTDPLYRTVSLPSSYWKVAVMVRASDHRLSATGYVVSQSDLLTGLEFVYGQFKTYQVPIARIEHLTGIDFGRLELRDPLRLVEAPIPRELLTPSDLLI